MLLGKLSVRRDGARASRFRRETESHVFLAQSVTMCGERELRFRGSGRRCGHAPRRGYHHHHKRDDQRIRPSTEPVTIPGQSVWGALKSPCLTGNSVTFGFVTGAADYYAKSMYSGHRTEPVHRAVVGRQGHRAGGVLDLERIINLTITEAASSAHPERRRILGAEHRLGLLSGNERFLGRCLVWPRQEFPVKAGGLGRPFLGSYEYATSLHEIGHALD